MKTCSFCGVRKAEYVAWPGSVLCREDAMRVGRKLPWLKMRPMAALAKELKSLAPKMAQQEYTPHTPQKESSGLFGFLNKMRERFSKWRAPKNREERAA